jgi:hypothetical protein
VYDFAEIFQTILCTAPAAARDQTTKLLSMAYSLDRLVQQISHAVALKDFVRDARESRNRPEFERAHAWDRMAFRDAALAIWDVRILMTAIQRLLEDSAELRAFADMEAFKAASHLYKQHFPDAKALRDVEGHFYNRDNPRLAFAPTPEVSNPTGGMTITGNRLGDSISHTTDKKVIGFELNQDTVNAMSQVRDEVFSAFKRASPWPRIP